MNRNGYAILMVLAWIDWDGYGVLMAWNWIKRGWYDILNHGNQTDKTVAENSSRFFRLRLVLSVQHAVIVHSVHSLYTAFTVKNT